MKDMGLRGVLEERTERARKKALPLIERWDKMNLDEKLAYMRANRTQYKKEMNIINRYYNLEARN